MNKDRYTIQLSTSPLGLLFKVYLISLVILKESVNLLLFDECAGGQVVVECNGFDLCTASLTRA